MADKQYQKLDLSISDEYKISPWKKDFPIFTKPVLNNKPLVYLDSAASAQKPSAVLNRCLFNMENEYANVHRGIHYLSETETALFEKARHTVQNFINAKSANEIIFTRGATESLNLVVRSFGKANLKNGDDVIITEAEHHANIVPWQLLQEEIDFNIRVIPVLDDGSLDYETFKNLLSEKTKIVSVTQMSNVLGTIMPIQDIINDAHKAGAVVILDGAQAITHLPIDVQELDCDFYAFSGHKLYAPTGIGVLYGKREILENMPPYQGGGDMVKNVSFAKTTFADVPARFEAGTPSIVQAIGLGAAMDYLNSIGGMKVISEFEDKVFNYLYQKIRELDDVKILGNAPYKGGLVAFVMEGLNPQDISMILNQMGIAVRVGHHCAQPITERMGVKASVRASLGLYNGTDDVDALIAGLLKAKDML